MFAVIQSFLWEVYNLWVRGQIKPRVVTSSTKEMWHPSQLQTQRWRWNKASATLEGQTLPFATRKWQPTPVFLPGKSHGSRSLVGSPWGHKESDTTEWLHLLSFFLHAVLVLFLHWSFYGNSSLMPDLSVVGSGVRAQPEKQWGRSGSKSVTEHVSHM